MSLSFSRPHVTVINAFKHVFLWKRNASYASFNCSSRVNREGKKWRAQHKLPSHINQTPALMEGADFTYVDGRPTPYGMKQYERIKRQQELAKQMVLHLGEINYAVERYNRLQREEKQKEQDIINRKLKPKGGFISDK